MKKASNILYLITIIASIVGAIIIAISASVLLNYSSAEYTEAIANNIKNGSVRTSYTGTYTEQAEQIQALFKGLGIFYMIVAGLFILAAIVSIIARHSSGKGIHVFAIVIGIISLTIIPTVAGCLALSAKKREDQYNMY